MLCEIALEKYILDLIIRTRHVILLKVGYDNLPTAKVLSQAEKAALNIESTQKQAMVSKGGLGGGLSNNNKGTRQSERPSIAKKT